MIFRYVALFAKKDHKIPESSTRFQPFCCMTRPINKYATMEFRGQFLSHILGKICLDSLHWS